MSDISFEAIFEHALDPMLVADDDARYVDANPAACELFGLSRAQLCTHRVVDFAPPQAKAQFDTVWKRFLRDGKQRGDYQLQMPDGRICDIEFSATANVVPGRHLSIIRDVSQRKRLEAERNLANREIAVHIAVSDTLEDWEGLKDGGTRLLRGVAEAMDFAFGALWLPDRDLLVARLVWSAPSLIEAPEFEAATLALRVPRCIKLPGLAWQRKQPVSIIDVVADSDYRRRSAAARAGLRGAVAFPALHASEVLAVFEFYYREEARPTARWTHTMSAIGYEIGSFLSRRWSQMHEPPLTPRELQVLQLVADGHSGPEIAKLLEVTTGTIATHMKHIFNRLGGDDRAGAVAVGIRLGLIE